MQWISSPAPRQRLHGRRSAFLLLAKAHRTASGWIEALNKRRELRAASAVLHAMSDRELKDIGVYRGTIDFMISHAAESRFNRS